MPRILIVDDDSSTRAAIVSRLSRPQREIETAANGEQALSIASTFHPHLVLTDILMPGLDGWALVDGLRARKETAHAVVIIVTELDNAMARIHALRLGAVDFLRKPVHLEELELRVENALHYSVRPQRLVDAAPVDGFAGSLAHISLGSVLNLLSLDHKSGELQLARGVEEARLLLRDGAVVSASFVHPRDRDGLDGAPCVYELLRWRSGHFAFTHRAVPAKDELHMPTPVLLLQGALLVDQGIPPTRRAG